MSVPTRFPFAILMNDLLYVILFVSFVDLFIKILAII